jgi:hypothetical protein
MIFAQAPFTGGGSEPQMKMIMTHFALLIKNDGGHHERFPSDHFSVRLLPRRIRRLDSGWWRSGLSACIFHKSNFQRNRERTSQLDECKSETGAIDPCRADRELGL